MKISASLLLIAAGFWITGFIIASLTKGHAGIPAILFILCIFTGLVTATIAALIFLYSLTKFLITKDPRFLQ